MKEFCKKHIDDNKKDNEKMITKKNFPLQMKIIQKKLKNYQIHIGENLAKKFLKF